MRRLLIKIKNLLPIITIVATISANGQFAGVVYVPPPIIVLDSDMTSDVDDLNDLKLCITAQKKQQAHVASVICTGESKNGAVAAKTILEYSNLPTSPTVGMNWNGGSEGSFWVDTVQGEFKPNVVYEDTEYTLSQDRYPEVLASYPDGSVTIIVTGWVTVLMEAYNANTALFDAKVKEYIVVAGIYPKSDTAGSSQRPAEFNMTIDKPAWNEFMTTITKPIYWAGIELADTIFIPFRPVGQPSTDPAKFGWDYFWETYTVPAQNPDTAQRQAWGQMGILYAIYRDEYFTLSAPGYNTINLSNGANTFVENPSGTQYYLRKSVSNTVLRNKIIEELDDSLN